MASSWIKYYSCGDLVGFALGVSYGGGKFGVGRGTTPFPPRNLIVRFMVVILFHIRVLIIHP